MSLKSIQADAETQAEQIISDLQERLQLLLARTDTTSAVNLDAMRSQGIETIASTFRNAANGFSDEYKSSFALGKAAAEKSLKGVSSYSFNDLNSFIGITQNSFDQLQAQFANEYSTLIGRVKLGSVSESELYRKLRFMFDSPTAKARGIVSTEVEIIYSYAFNGAIKDLTALNAMKARQGVIKGKQAAEEPVTIMVWRHSHGGNPPRWNHVEMHGKGVVEGIPFQLENRDGDGIYNTFGPHSPDLPAEEVINCHCSKVARVVWVLPSEKKSLQERSRSEGGIFDKRWAIG